MQTRVKFRWIVTLMRLDDGKQMPPRVVSAYWDPERPGTEEAIGHAAKAEAYMASNKQHQYAVLTVQRAEDAEGGEG